MKLKEIVKACNGELVFGNENEECQNFSKDTRTINKGDIYVGIKGENFDGNTLYKQAFEKGAKVCILQGINKNELNEFKNEIYDEKNTEINAEINSENNKETISIILVEDTIKALQQIASYKRSLYNIPVIAITGSVGKTSTKDIVASVVSTKYKVHKTQGNLNNHIGVPLTILQLNKHEALVVEMGMNNLGEISVLSKIAKPNIAIITNVGTAHIGNLGSRENIRKAKLEILDGMQNGGTLIINNDNDMLHDWYENIYKNDNENKYQNIKVITYGIENNSDIMAENIDLQPNSSTFNVIINEQENNKKFDIKKHQEINQKIEQKNKIQVPIGGMHFVYNALCAILVGKEININIEQIKTGIETFELSKSRMELIKISNGATLINDCYNANYDSMKAGLEYLSKTAKSRKIAVLGDMLELGEYSNQLHKQVGEEVIKNKIDILVTVGEQSRIIAEEANKNCQIVKSFTNNQQAIEYLKQIIMKDDTILIKASNGMKFKEIVDALSKC